MTTKLYQLVFNEILAGNTLIIDGAIGTELQRRGVPMADEAWCALATESSPDMLRTVHLDYIAAGARIVTANTFASTRQVLKTAGHGARFVSLNRQSVEIAVEAREQSDAAQAVLVASSISPHRPGQYNNQPSSIDASRFEADCTEMAAIHKEAGADLILAEMMGDPLLSPCVIRAAKANDLPVWVGFAFRPGKNGILGTCSHDQTPIAEVLAPIIAAGGDVMGVMHTRAEHVSETIAALKRHWPGPLMAYPDDIPYRKSVKEAIKLNDVIEETKFVEYCKTWRAEGVTLLGGCCGLTVSHIKALENSIKN